MANETDRLGAGGTPGVKPDNRARLNEALDRFVAAEKWPEAMDVLRTLARESTGVREYPVEGVAGDRAGPEADRGVEAGVVAEPGFGVDEDPGVQFGLADGEPRAGRGPGRGR